MYVDHEYAGRSAQGRPGPVAIGAGLVTALAAHLVPLLVMVAIGSGNSARALVEQREKKEEEILPVEFVPAEFVKRGRKFEANKLPNRRLPQKSSRIDTPPPPQRGGNAPPRDRPDAGPQPEDAEEDGRRTKNNGIFDSRSAKSR